MIRLAPRIRCFFSKSQKICSTYKIEDSNEKLPPPNKKYRESGTKWLEKIVVSSPESIQPYLKLMRFDRPIGTWLLYLPCTWGVALGTPIGEWVSLYTLTLFGLGALLMRGAGCTINDMWDRDFDRHVDRTKTRPIASGVVSMPNALAFVALQMSVALIVLLQFNIYSIVLGFASTILVASYPLFKRFTHWPQVILGICMTWGVPLGYTTVKYPDPISSLCLENFCLGVILPLFFSGIFWTIINDTTYGLQDIEDDKMLGLKSTAIFFGDKCKLWMSGFAVGMGAMLFATGYNYGAGPIYYTGMSLAMAHVAYQIYALRINDRTHCLDTFKSNRNTGLAIFAAIALDRALQTSALFG